MWCGVVVEIMLCVGIDKVLIVFVVLFQCGFIGGLVCIDVFVMFGIMDQQWCVDLCYVCVLWLLVIEWD